MNEKKRRNEIDVLTDENYEIWRFEMEMLLKTKKLWRHCGAKREPGYRDEEDEPEVKKLLKIKQDDERGDEEEDDQKARALIALHVDRKFYSLIKDDSTARETWRSIEKYFNKTKNVTRLKLNVEFYSVKMRERENLNDYVDKVQVLWERLKGVGDTLSEIQVVFKIVSTLNHEYAYVLLNCMSVEEDRLSLSFIKSQSRIQDNMKREKDRDHGEALLTCYNCRGDGHIAKFCPNELREKQKKWIKKKGEKAGANSVLTF